MLMSLSNARRVPVVEEVSPSRAPFCIGCVVAWTLCLFVVFPQTLRAQVASVQGPLVRVEEPLPSVEALVVPAEPLPDDSGSATLESVEDDVESGVLKAVQSWAGAWRRREPDNYLDFYSQDFRLPEGLRRSIWEDQRRWRINALDFITVELEDVEVSISGSRDHASVRFIERYRSNLFATSVKKILELREEKGHWRILRESSSPIDG